MVGAQTLSPRLSIGLDLPCDVFLSNTDYFHIAFLLLEDTSTCDKLVCHQGRVTMFQLLLVSWTTARIQCLDAGKFLKKQCLTSRYIKFVLNIFRQTEGGKSSAVGCCLDELLANLI